MGTTAALPVGPSRWWLPCLTGIVLLAPLPANASEVASASAERVRKCRGFDDGVALLAVGSHNTQRKQAASRQKRPKDPAWFATLDESMPLAESSDRTADWTDGNERLNFDPTWRNPGRHQITRVPGPWFHEAASGGPKEAWQTHYPAAGDLQESLTDRYRQEGRNGRWVQTGNGWYMGRDFGQRDRHMQWHIGHKDVTWFDTSIMDYDIFGREAPPDKGTPHRILLDEDGAKWQERAVSHPVTCKARECVGTSQLNPFDGGRELAQNCRLSIYVHPTDFDQDWSKESVEYWQVNGYTVKSHCTPMVSGCQTPGARPLLPCVRDMHIDHLVDPDVGILKVEGKLSKMVDECPYNGNLLSSVVLVTCLVRPKPPPPVPRATVAPALEVLRQDERLTETTTERYLRCSEPGCMAQAQIYVDPKIAYVGGTCLMNITMAQTDFDSTHSSELLDYIKLKGRALPLVQNWDPGNNPCEHHAGWAWGKSARGPRLPNPIVAVVTDENITAEVSQGDPLQIVAKISEYVDECDSNGYLLDSRVQIVCTPPSELAN